VLESFGAKVRAVLAVVDRGEVFAAEDLGIEDLGIEDLQRL